MIVVRLHDFYEGAIRKTTICSLENGQGYTNKTYEFLPDTEYTFKDPIIIKYFKGEIGDVNEQLLATPELKETLRAHKVPFELKKCSSCPTAKPHVVFNPFVIEEYPDDDVQN